MENAIVWLLVTLVGSFGGAWFGAYFKKKGENYATREDVGELTRVTKGIEAKISDEVWNPNHNPHHDLNRFASCAR